MVTGIKYMDEESLIYAETARQPTIVIFLPQLPKHYHINAMITCSLIYNF